MIYRKPKQTGCPAWILEGVRKKREEATAKTQPPNTKEINK